MKALLIASVLMNSTVFAQALDVNALKNLMTERKAVLESIHAGMSKRTVSVSNIKLPNGVCNFTHTSTQSILKIEGEHIIIHATEDFAPANTPTCKQAQYEAYVEKVLFYEAKPSLKEVLADLDMATKDIVSLSRAGNIITMMMNITEIDENNQPQVDKVTFQYDLSKSSFRNLVLTKGQDYTTTTVDIADVNPNSFNLRDVFFCENNDGDSTNCVRGDFSDILF